MEFRKRHLAVASSSYYSKKGYKLVLVDFLGRLARQSHTSLWLVGHSVLLIDTPLYQVWSWVGSVLALH